MKAEWDPIIPEMPVLSKISDPNRGNLGDPGKIVGDDPRLGVASRLRIAGWEL